MNRVMVYAISGAMITGHMPTDGDMNRLTAPQQAFYDGNSEGLVLFDATIREPSGPSWKIEMFALRREHITGFVAGKAQLHD